MSDLSGHAPGMIVGWTDWLALALAIAFTLGCIAISCCMIADDLEDTEHEAVLDELWGPDEDWIEP